MKFNLKPDKKTFQTQGLVYQNVIRKQKLFCQIFDETIVPKISHTKKLIFPIIITLSNRTHIAKQREQRNPLDTETCKQASTRTEEQ